MTTETKEYIEPLNFEGTKGEWEFEKHYIGKYFGNIISNFGDRQQRTIDVLLKNASDEEMKANAILLSNAKELLKALQELMRFESLFNHVAPELQYPDNFLNATLAAKEVINKALNINP